MFVKRHQKHIRVRSTRLGRLYPAVKRLEERCTPTTFVVTNMAGGGAGSLRQAILDANAHAGADIISFSIGSGAQTINPATALPVVTNPVTIDGAIRRLNEWANRE